MLFHVKMTVKLPVDMNLATAAQLKPMKRRWPNGCSAKARGATVAHCRALRQLQRVRCA